MTAPTRTAPRTSAADQLGALLADRIGGTASARCGGCAVPLAELAAPLRVTIADQDGHPVRVVITHAHLVGGGVACAVPAPVRCARPHCALIAPLVGAWCWLCDPASTGQEVC